MCNRKLDPTVLLLNSLKSGPTWTNTYLPSTSNVCDMNSPRVLSKTCTDTEPESHGNLAYFNTELSGNRKAQQSDHTLTLSYLVTKKVQRR